MLKAQFDNVKNILCLGSHADDIEIGCGGTILKLLDEYESLHVHWVVLSATPKRAEEAIRSAESFLSDAGRSQIVVKDFRDRFFPYDGEAIKGYFDELGQEVSPDIILTHRLEDRHQDHRLVAELTWNTFRNHLIFEYEIPKYEGDLGTPNIFVPLSERTCQRKVEITTKTFESQHDKGWFSEDTFWSLMRLRGLESNSSSGFAEALYCRKLTF